MSDVTPARIMEIGLGFLPAKTLLSAVELDLFSLLAQQPMSALELQQTLGLHPRANPDFFDALDAALDHPVDRVTPAAANADHFDPGTCDRWLVDEHF